MNWEILYSDEYLKALKKIDKSSAKRIMDYLDKIPTLKNPMQKGKALKGYGKGFWRYRIGDYRVIVKVIKKKLTVIAVDVGHRNKIYKKQ
jgi:mRNA interferase RelE/StbE